MSEQDWSADPELEPFIFIINMAVPGSPQYSVVFYFALPACILGQNREYRVLQNYFNGTQEYCDARLKLIPLVAEGNWIVKRGVGSTPAILGSKLKISYFKGKNYFESVVDIGVSSMGGAIVRLVTGPARGLVIDLGFLIEAKLEEELPEEMIGVCRIRNCDLNGCNSLLGKVLIR